jgi:hypothetical protein
MATLAAQEYDPGFGAEVEITADKPGRYVRVERPAAGRNLTLAIQHRSARHDGIDHWTWLTPQEARELSEALIVAATADPEAEPATFDGAAEPLAGRLLHIQLQQLALICTSARSAVAPLAGGVPEVRALIEGLSEVCEAGKALEERLNSWKRQSAF